MPSPTDFNQSPYYDDFTESKKFHRILFVKTFLKAKSLIDIKKGFKYFNLKPLITSLRTINS